MKNIKHTIISTLILSGPVNAQTIFSQNFESTGLSNGKSISAYPTLNGTVSAINTDGELFTSGGQSGAFVDLLQNRGANTNTPWNESTAGRGGYDRIAMITTVNANTQYDLNFYHNSALDRFGYAGSETLVQIQSLDTTYATSQTFTTPDSSWTQESLSFTTDSSTSQIAILFSAMGADHSSTSIDSISLANTIPEPSSTTLLGLGAFALIARRKRQ